MAHASPPPPRKKWRNRKSRSLNLQLEYLESRALLSVSLPKFSIPGFPGGIPGLPSTLLPNFTNGLDLGSLNSYFNPAPSDFWWLNNTGQTLTNPISGPAIGTPGADIDATGAWNITTGNSNVVVAVLDTGIDLSNASLNSVLWTNPGEIPGDGIDNDGDGKIDDVHGWNFLDNSSDVSDNFVHGTAVADVIHSVAPGVTILPVEIGTSSGVNAQDVINGINYIINLKQHGVNVVAINASYISFTAPSQGEVNAISSAGNNGIPYVAAAGNAGMNLDSLIPNLPASLDKYIPQLLPQNLIFVAATDDQDNLASFSDYGSHTVSVGAPGVDITVQIPGGLYVPLSGTSFAAPMVSGIVALLASRFPTATMSQIKAAILNSGDLDPALAGKTITGRRVDALKALDYLMGNQLPSGKVETMNNSVVSGWAFDPNLGAGAATVQLSVDGVITQTLPANVERDDLSATLGSPDHGFSFDVSSLAYGKHVIKVYVLDNATGKQTLLGQGTLIVDQNPQGALESATTKNVTGWAYDPDTSTASIPVKLYIDGRAWVGATANVERDDLTASLGSANHGFSINLPNMPAGIHRIDAYAIDTLTAARTLIGSAEVSSSRLPTGGIDSLTAATLAGWAFDPDSGAAPIQISYTIDNFAPVFVTANVSRPDLVGQLGSKNHGFSINLPQLMAGEHTITVNAVDPSSKALVQIGQQDLIISDPDGNPLPVGSVSLTSTAVSGIVADASSSGPINIRVDIDGKPGKPFLSTPDANPSLYDFSFDLSSLKGSHRIDVYAMDDQTGTPVLIDRDFFNNTTFNGAVESVSATSITGWATASSSPTHQAQLRLDVDGLTGALVTARLPRPDLLATAGILNSGFNIAIPDLPPGDHTFTLYLIDPLTLNAVPLLSQTITTT